MKVLTLATFDYLSGNLQSNGYHCLFPTIPETFLGVAYDYPNYKYYWYTLQPRIKEAFEKAQQKIPGSVIPTDEIHTEEFLVEGNYFYITKHRATYYLVQTDGPLSTEQACTITLPFRSYTKQENPEKIQDFVDGLNSQLHELLNYKPMTTEQLQSRMKRHMHTELLRKTPLILSEKEIKDTMLANIDKMLNENGNISDLVKQIDDLSNDISTSFIRKPFKPKPTFMSKVKGFFGKVASFVGSLFCCGRRHRAPEPLVQSKQNQPALRVSVATLQTTQSRVSESRDSQNNNPFWSSQPVPDSPQPSFNNFRRMRK